MPADSPNHETFDSIRSLFLHIHIPIIHLSSCHHTRITKLEKFPHFFSFFPQVSPKKFHPSVTSLDHVTKENYYPIDIATLNTAITLQTNAKGLESTNPLAPFRSSSCPSRACSSCCPCSRHCLARCKGVGGGGEGERREEKKREEKNDNQLG